MNQVKGDGLALIQRISSASRDEVNVIHASPGLHSWPVHGTNCRKERERGREGERETGREGEGGRERERERERHSNGSGVEETLILERGTSMQLKHVGLALSSTKAINSSTWV